MSNVLCFWLASEHQTPSTLAPFFICTYKEKQFLAYAFQWSPLSATSFRFSVQIDRLIFPGVFPAELASKSHIMNRFDAIHSIDTWKLLKKNSHRQLSGWSRKIICYSSHLKRWIYPQACSINFTNSPSKSHWRAAITAKKTVTRHQIVSRQRHVAKRQIYVYARMSSRAVSRDENFILALFRRFFCIFVNNKIYLFFSQIAERVKNMFLLA